MVNNVYTVNIREMPLVDLVEIRSARRPRRVEVRPFDSSLPYVTIKMLETGASGQYADKAGYVVGENDLVMVKDGYRSGKVFFAQEGIAASTLAVLSLKNDDVLTSYLYCYLSYRYDDFQKRIKGAAIGHLDMNYLKQMVIPVPDMATQQEVADKFQRIEELTNELKQKTQRLKELSMEMSRKDLKKKCDELNLQAEMTLKAWLNEVFKKPL